MYRQCFMLLQFGKIFHLSDFFSATPNYETIRPYVGEMKLCPKLSFRPSSLKIIDMVITFDRHGGVQCTMIFVTADTMAVKSNDHINILRLMV